MKPYLLILPMLCIGLASHADSCCSAPPTAETATAALPEQSMYHLEGSWTQQDGDVMTLADFQGAPCLVTMFFTSCTYACPMLVEDLKRISSTLSENQKTRLQIVLLSFDSERDHPEALKEFARLRDLTTPPWALLHSDADTVRDTAAVLGVRYRQDETGNFAHSNIITLLNDKGEIVYQLNGLRADSAPLMKAIGELIEP